MLEQKELYLEKIHTDMNRDDMITKILSKEKLEVCRKVAGLMLVGSCS